MRFSPTNAVESALCAKEPISVSILSILPPNSLIDSKLMASLEFTLDETVSNCCFSPSITPPNESIFEAFEDMVSIEILIASSSAFTFEDSATPSIIFSNSCLRL